MKRVKVGMIGLGEIAQIIHLPVLQSMPERFELVALCDVSPGLLALMGEKHRVNHLYESALDMLDRVEMDAVFVLNNMEFHTECTVAALKKNIHVFVEKPMCVTDREAEEIIRARDASRAQVMVGYMRRFAPAYVRALEEVKALGPINYARVRDMIGPNAFFTGQSGIHVHRFGDLPAEAVQDRKDRNARLMKEAVGEASAEHYDAYGLLLGLNSHDLSAMREMLGMPLRVKAASSRQGGRFKNAILEYDGFDVMFETGVDQQGRFDAHIEVFGERRSVLVQYNRPSPVWWNGDNENGMSAGEEDPDYPGRAIAERITGRLCADLDPSRPFQPTSPYGGSTNNSFTIGTAHYTGALFEMFEVFRNTDLRDYRSYFASLLSRFCPEFPMFGTPEVHTLQRMMNDEDLADPSYDMLEYHTKNHPGLKDFSLFRALATLADKLAPPAASTPEQIRRMSFVQHELTRLTVEAYRRNRHYTGGLLFWMYNDCWPASGWSLVDYYGYPKGGYYGFKQAARPVIASIEKDAAAGTYECWVCSDKPEAIRGTGTLRVLKLDGLAEDAEVWSGTFDFAIGAGASAVAAEIPAAELDALLDHRHVLVMDITLAGGFGEDRCIYFAGLPAEMKLAPSGLRIESRAGGPEAGSVTVAADRYAKAVLLHGAFVFSDNYFDLLPGERRTIAYRSLEVATFAVEPGDEAGDEEPAIELIAWN